MDIGFVGAGKVGCSLGKYIACGASRVGGRPDVVAGYYSRTKESADIAATFTRSRSFESLKDIVGASEAIFITTPDGAIAGVWEDIRKYDLRDKAVCHFSGSLSSDIFSGIEETGASCCSIHPMYAFSDKFTSYLNFGHACLTIEGNGAAVGAMRDLFEKRLGHAVFLISPSDKAKYHAAATLASNCAVALVYVAQLILCECGFSESDAERLIAPLALDNMKNVVEKGVADALTGPVERGDLDTVKRHFEALDGTVGIDAYKSLGRALVDIAKKKNPERDYDEIAALFKKGDDAVPARNGGLK